MTTETIRKSRKSKVFNNSNKEYVEVMKDKEYRIPANGEITLGRREAIEFFGRYPGYGIEKPLKIEHIDPAVEEEYTCNFCGESFINEILLANHLKEHEEFSGAAKKKEPTESEKVFLCPYPGCGFETKKKGALLGHMRKHKNEEIADDSESNTDNSSESNI